MAQEYTLDTNIYNEPKIYSGKDAIAAKLLLLLNMVPGTNPLHPEMGIDLAGRYRYCSPEDVDTLSGVIEEQVKVYLPDYETIIKVECQFDSEQHFIETYIRIDDTVFQFATNDDTTTLRLDSVGGALSDEEIPDNPNEDLIDDDEDMMKLASVDDMNETDDFPFDTDEQGYGQLPPGVASDD